MGVTWKNNRRPEDFGERIKARIPVYREEMEEILARAVEAGAQLFEEYLELAVTGTGIRRVQMGLPGTEGRHNTGRMVESIRSNADSPSVVQNETIGSWGFFAADFMTYFRDQDIGEGSIPAANALPTSFVIAREQFRAETRALFGK